VVAIGSIVQGLDALITGQVPGGLFGPQGLTGPDWGIATITAQSVNQGWLNYIFLVAILSVALGFTNLLPIPAPRRGAASFVALIEWVRRRPFDRKKRAQRPALGSSSLCSVSPRSSASLDIQRIATGQFLGRALVVTRRKSIPVNVGRRG